MAKKIMKLLFAILALLMMGCECPYLEERTKNDYEYYHQTGQDRLYADKLPGLWQCYYPMIIGGVEFKEMRIFSNGNADIIMEDVGGTEYYSKTFRWRYDGRYITFTKSNTTYQFQITGYLFPELYIRDSFGTYTLAKRLTEDCM